METILVTGATGTIGSRVVSALSGRAGVQVRATVRDEKKGASLAASNVELVHFDWTSRASVEAAIAGVDKVFLLTPIVEDQVNLGKGAIDAARAAGVKHLVKLSTSGAEFEPGILFGRWHREVEKHAEASGIPTTILRPGAFMTNFIGYTAPDAQGNIYMPIGEGASAFVDVRDVADVAASVLTSDGHAGKAYTLTGPAALTIHEVAAHIGAASGRTVRYVDIPEAAARGAMLGMGFPTWMVDGMLELYGIMKAGYTAGVANTVAEITGRPARSFAEFARDHAAAWKV